MTTQAQRHPAEHLEQQPGILIEPGRYPAVLTRVDAYDLEEGWEGRPADAPVIDGKEEQLWFFDLEVSPSLTVACLESGGHESGCKEDELRRWASRLLGRELAGIPNTRERAELIGRPCWVDIQIRYSGPPLPGRAEGMRTSLVSLDLPGAEFVLWRDDSSVLWSNDIVNVEPRDS